MGVLPLQFENGQDRKSLKLTGKEVLNIRGLGGELKPHMPLSVEVTREDGSQDSFKVLCRIDTLNEVEVLQGRRHPPLRAAQHAEAAAVRAEGWLRPPLFIPAPGAASASQGERRPGVIRRYPRTGGWPPRAYPPGLPSPCAPPGTTRNRNALTSISESAIYPTTWSVLMLWVNSYLFSS